MFCTADGSTLVSDEAYTPPAPTLVMPESSSLDTSVEAARPTVTPVASSTPLWQPPPPPMVVTGPSQSLAVTSMVLGLVSITLGWCCSFGLLTAPVAIVLGIYSLSQIKSQPERYSGKPLAIAGIVTGALYFVALVVIVIIYGLGILLSGLKSF